MESVGDKKRVPLKGDSGRDASRPGGPPAHGEDRGAAVTLTCAAAHERAVMTVRLTLLLLIVGIALFLFTGPGGVLPSGQGDSVEHHK